MHRCRNGTHPTIGFGPVKCPFGVKTAEVRNCKFQANTCDLQVRKWVSGSLEEMDLLFFVKIGFRMVGFRMVGFRRVGFRRVGFRMVGFRMVGFRMWLVCR